MASDPSGEALRVVVIGASLAGLFAAAAVAQAGHEVVVLERDRLTDTPTPRPGVPQGEQPHVFLLRGLLAAEDLLPGLRADLESQGAVPFDSARLAWLGEQGWLPVGESGFEIISLTRPLFEQVVRRRVLELDGVQLLDDTRVKGLRRNDLPGQPRWCVETSVTGEGVDVTGEGIDGDLVIDASGRGSRLPVWLADLGISTPRVSEIDPRTGYATRVYSTGPHLDGLSGILLQSTPDTPVGGMAFPVENGRWLVAALGRGEQRPPRDISGFEAFLHRLPETAVADFADRCTPCGDVELFRQTENRRYHYERLRDWPDGLLVMGDAFIVFNPVFGQGITVAACEALVLRDGLTGGLRPRDARKLMRRFAAAAALPWSVAVGQDLRAPTTEGTQTRSQALTNAWARELTRLAVHGNARAMSVMTRLYHLMGSPRMLLHPALLGAALRARVVGYGPAAPRPAGLDAMVRA